MPNMFSVESSILKRVARSDWDSEFHHKKYFVINASELVLNDLDSLWGDAQLHHSDYGKSDDVSNLFNVGSYNTKTDAAFLGDIKYLASTKKQATRSRSRLFVSFCVCL